MNTLKTHILLLFLSLLFVTISCNKSIKNENNKQESKNITIKNQVNFNNVKTDKKNSLDTLAKNKVYDYFNFLNYAKFSYKSIIDTDSTIIEIPVCKSIFDDKKENIIDVDFGGSIYIKNEKGWDEATIKNINQSKTNKILRKYVIWAKIIHKDDYLLNKIDELRGGIPPDQPCLFYKEYPTYYIYNNNDTIWEFIKSTKKDNSIFKIINKSQ